MYGSRILSCQREILNGGRKSYSPTIASRACQSELPPVELFAQLLDCLDKSCCGDDECCYLCDRVVDVPALTRRFCQSRTNTRFQCVLIHRCSHRVISCRLSVVS